MLGVQRDAHRLQKDLYSRRRNIDISARITILYSSSSYLSMKAVPMKRQREDSPQSPALIEALDAIITPQSCFVHYDASLAASLAELKASIIASDPDLQSYQETVAQQQSPQGDVQRSSSDKRYMLSLLCINMGRLEELNPNGGDGVRRFYAEALLWHPDSIEAGFCLGVFLRHAVTAPEQLQLVHDLWLRAYTTGRAYNFFRRPSFAGNPGVPYVSYNRMIQNREKGIMKELSDMLILHNCQQGDLATATVYLKAFRYQYKLSQAVLCYTKTSLSVDKAEGTVKKAVCGYAGGVDSAVSPEVLARLQHVFRPDSPFWREHNYDFYSNASRSVGYFSYVYPFRELAPENVVELAISRIYDIVAVKFPEIAAKATIAEWWVHSRPHSCGHQFHFDSDETLIYAGKKAQHPIMSCVLYLTPDSDGGESVGGPTVVTNQTLQSEGLATEGFMFLPRENRMVTFDARYLHGVVPGRGVCPGPENSRRVTFMVGFWEKIESKNRGVDSPGPGQPYPGRHVAGDGEAEVNVSQYSWPSEMGMVREDASESTKGKCHMEWLDPIPIPAVWEPVDEEELKSSVEGTTYAAHYNSCFQGF